MIGPFHWTKDAHKYAWPLRVSVEGTVPNTQPCRHKWKNTIACFGTVNVLDCVKCGAEKWPMLKSRPRPRPRRRRAK